MDGEAPPTVCNVVAVPYPGRGHINPMMNLCKHLLLTHHATPPCPQLLITFVVTEEWLGLIGSQETPPCIRFATIPNVLPSELDRAADMPTFVTATQTKMGNEFERLLEDMPVNFIIADTFLNWAVEFGNRRNIPVASLWSMPASVFSIFYHFDLLIRNGHHPFQLCERGMERLGYIPGIPSIRLADTPSIIHTKDQRLLRLALRVFSNVSKAQYLLLSTIEELETHAVQALKKEFSFPVYTFGPAIPYSFKDTISSSTNKQIGGDHCYFEWLNSQPPSSVLYVSLGSFLSVSSSQMDEIADGLCQSRVRFLWVARGEATRLQERCGDVGRVVAWCEQLKVLCHSSVGGFWTHCGWNSTMESIFAGVPLIAIPILMDQTTVRKHIVEDWKIGWDAKRQDGMGVDQDLLTSGEIATVINKFMDPRSLERKEMTARAKQLQEATWRAISDGGSPMANVTCFLNNIMSSSSN